MQKGNSIELKKISKKYQINNFVTSSILVSKDRKKFETRSGILWALKDVSFDVKEGEIVGIIGSNGSGKTTLLKILSRITDPTSGRAYLEGKVASMLEVGTGFHPELTGRENVFLNGAILGMDKKEVKKKYDNIVDFAGIKKFMDTPVKKYSSGMYVRLAFSVASHLSSDILLIDEVLAVGDHSFRQKSLQKMQEIRNSGRTILVVSHNLRTIRSTCNRTLYLKKGKLVEYGDTNRVLDRYISDNQKINKLTTRRKRRREGLQEVVIEKIIFKDKNGDEIRRIKSGDYLKIDIILDSSINKKQKVEIEMVFYNELQERLFKLTTGIRKEGAFELSGSGNVSCIVPEVPLSFGSYSMDIVLKTAGVTQDRIEQAKQLKVSDSDFFNTGFVYNGWIRSGILVKHQWK